MSDKPRFPRSDALAVAKEICDELKPVCARLVVAGSLRRRKPEVGDVEILFIPKIGMGVRAGELLQAPMDLAEAAIERMIFKGVIEARKNAKGGTAMGRENKLVVHRASGIPVDLFTSNEQRWFSYLVCRTGGAMNNKVCASRAQDMGYSWKPYEGCFARLSDGERIPITSEEQFFEFLGAKYREPWERP